MQPKDLDGASHPRAFFGAEVRRLREAAGLTQQELGQRLYVSGSYIGQLEVGSRWPRRREQAEDLDRALNTDGHLARVWDLADRAPEYPDYFVDLAKREPLATKIEHFSASVIYGLLQTPDYARALFRADGPYWSKAEINERALARVNRAGILGDTEDPTDLQLWEIVDEAALRRPVGGPEIMRAQLLHLADLMDTHRIVLQVLPFACGAHALTGGSVTVMEFTDLPTVAYVEGPHAGQVLTNQAKVRDVRLSYDLVRAAALSPEASLAFLESVLKEYAP